MAYKCPEVYPILGRMAENSCISNLVADGGCHDKQCYSGREDERHYQATRVHSGHQQF